MGGTGAKGKKKRSKESKSSKDKKITKDSKEPTSKMPDYCMAESAETDDMVKESIFDPPTADEMVQIAIAMSSFDFSDVGPNITLTPAPLAGPDRAAIAELFGDSSTATTMLTSPGKHNWWNGLVLVLVNAMR